MLVHVLGTAAGGGVPQWNCACPGCAGARTHALRRRRHDALALQAAPGHYYLVGAGPDLGEQLADCPDLHPGPGPRETPVAGVILTDAELDHTLGLARLREAQEVELLATRPVLDAVLNKLALGETLFPYTRLTPRELGPAPQPLAPGSSVEISAIGVSGKRPRYAADAKQAGNWVSALDAVDRATGRRLLYAPAIGVWPEWLDGAAAAADCVLVDGTFWDDQEPVRAGFTERTATAMGHLPITGPGGTAERLAALDVPRRLYTHLNNTNPLTAPGAAEHQLLDAHGLEVAHDGMVLQL